MKQKNKHAANSFSANVDTESEINQDHEVSQTSGRKNQNSDSFTPNQIEQLTKLIQTVNA